MKLFRNKLDKKLYYISWLGRDKTISPPKGWNHWWAFPHYHTNDIIYIGKELNTNSFTLVSEI